jgi:hypothetical protein
MKVSFLLHYGVSTEAVLTQYFTLIFWHSVGLG